MYQKWFRIGTATFQVNSPVPIADSWNTPQFQIPGPPDAPVDFVGTVELWPDRFMLHKTEDLGNGHFRLMFGRFRSRDIQDIIVLTAFPLFELLWRKKILVLHAAYVRHNGKAILFSGPPGVGKSTQASLWQNHRGAQILNGDRTLIYQRNGLFYAGSHLASGSSGICRNEETLLESIVFLDQGQENCAWIPTAPDAYRALTQQIFAMPSDAGAAQLASDLLNNVRICRFVCTPDESAVRYLEEFLYG